MRGSRPLLTYALLLVVPALAVVVFGVFSVAREDRQRRRDARRHAEGEAARMIEAEAAALERVRARETRRPFFHYQAKFMPPDATATGPAFVDSPLLAPPEDARVLGHFQWSLSQGVLSGPDLFPSPSPRWQATWAQAFAPALRAALARAPSDPEVRGAPVVEVPLTVLMANEEVGQLLEEVAVATAQKRATNYLENFAARGLEPSAGPVSGAPRPPAPSAPLPDDVATGATVPVRITPLAYLLPSPTSETGPGHGNLVAWRIVWVPGDVASARRSAPRDRWLLQGCVLDAGASFPAEPTSVGGDVVVARGGSFGLRMLWRSGPVAVARSLADASFITSGLTSGLTSGAEAGGAAAAGTPGRPLILDSLAVVAAVSEAALEAEREASWWRYGSLAAGLLLVTGIGLFVVGRSARREMAVAQRKQDFVAAVTHELKTPLASIRMHADMLKEGWVEGDGTVEDYAGRIVDETKRLASLVDQVLDFAALERGTATVRAVPGDLGVVVRDAVALVAPAAQAADVGLAVDVEPGLAPVPFDPTLVRALVVNLVDNAVKYSAGAEVRDVRVSVAAKSGGVEIAVADRGPGIASEDQGRLFQPFARGGREDTRTARGVGLGLALVRRYAEAHRAKVSLTSAPGRGTRVGVRFPR